MTRLSLIIIAAALLQRPAAADSPTTRLKELVSLEGVRENQLIGYGIVVGLKGTGDRQQTLFTAQSLTNMLQQMGVTVNPTTILVKNTAAVMVTVAIVPAGSSSEAGSSRSRGRRATTRPLRASPCLPRRDAAIVWPMSTKMRLRRFSIVY